MLPKVQQLHSMGKLVIEFPDVYRKLGKADPTGVHLGAIGPDQQLTWGWCYSKLALENSYRVIYDTLAGSYGPSHRQREGGFFKRGASGWHYFGEICIHSHAVAGRRGMICEYSDRRCSQRMKAECHDFVNNGKWNPHLEVLVEGGKLAPGKLEDVKKALRAALGVPDLIVKYGWVNKPGKMVQRVRYLTRPTFQNESWDPYMAAQIWGFRNIRFWGNWKGPAVWDLQQAEAQGEDVAGLEAVSKLQEHICPDCDAPLAVCDYRKKLNKRTGEHELVLDKLTRLPIPVYWSKLLPVVLLEAAGGVEICADYYRIPAGWIDHLPGPLPAAKMSLFRLRAINARLLLKLRLEARRKRRAENWRKYVLENWNRYILSGGMAEEDETGKM